jgi:hypothetical protein
MRRMALLWSSSLEGALSPNLTSTTESSVLYSETQADTIDNDTCRPLVDRLAHRTYDTRLWYRYVFIYHTV